MMFTISDPCTGCRLQGKCMFWNYCTKTQPMREAMKRKQTDRMIDEYEARRAAQNKRAAPWHAAIAR